MTGHFTTISGEGTKDDPRYVYSYGSGRLTKEQHDWLHRALNDARVAKRAAPGGGRQLSYLVAWEVRAHLIRTFGYGNFDVHVHDDHLVYVRDIEVGSQNKPGWEVAYKASVTLTIRDKDGFEICSYTESAVGSASGSVDLGGLHDNALKTAASDALKRCAINLGTQFGLSLYDAGNTKDVVFKVLISPDGSQTDTPSEAAGADLTDAQAKALRHTLGAEIATEATDPAPGETSDGAAPGFPNRIDTPEQAAAAVHDKRKR